MHVIARQIVMLSQLILNILHEAALLMIVASSLTPIYYIARFINIAHAAIISLAAYFTLALATELHLPLYTSIPLSVVLASLVGITCDLIVYRHLRRLKVSPLSQLIASIGLYVILQNCLSLLFGDQTRRIYIGKIEVAHNILGGYITTTGLITILVSIVIQIMLLFLMTKTRLGLTIRAVSDNPELSSIYGLEPDKAILMTFALGSAIGALAGILSAIDTTLSPTMGFSLLVYGLTVMIIAGVGSYKGLIGSALLIAAARHGSSYYIDAKWMDTVAYSILIIFLVWKPYGLSGYRLKKVEV